jgi:hypothetical protein
VIVTDVVGAGTHLPGTDRSRRLIAAGWADENR